LWWLLAVVINMRNVSRSESGLIRPYADASLIDIPLIFISRLDGDALTKFVPAESPIPSHCDGTKDNCAHRRFARYRERYGGFRAEPVDSMRFCGSHALGNS